MITTINSYDFYTFPPLGPTRLDQPTPRYSGKRVQREVIRDHDISGGSQNFEMKLCASDADHVEVSEKYWVDESISQSVGVTEVSGCTTCAHTHRQTHTHTQSSS